MAKLKTLVGIAGLVLGLVLAPVVVHAQYTRGNTFTAPILLSDGTAAAPAISFANDPNTGFYSYSADVLGWALGGTARGYFSGGTLNLIQDSSGIIMGAGGDIRLVRDGAANTLAMRNGGTAGAKVSQEFRLYNFCDGAACVTGYERGGLRWNGSNKLEIYTEAAGTGSATTLLFGVSAYTANLYPGSSDTYSLGGSTALYSTVYSTKGVQGSKSKSLTDAAAATAIWSCAIPSNDVLAGDVDWTVKSVDGSNNWRVAHGRNRFTAVNKAGTVSDGANGSTGPTTTMGSVGSDQAGGNAAVNLTCTWTQVINTTNLELQATCTDSTAGSQTITMYSRLDMEVPQTCTAQ